MTKLPRTLRPWAWALGVGLLVILSSCGGSGGDQSPPLPTTGGPSSGGEPFRGPATSLGVDAHEQSVQVEEVLSDGSVSAAEMERTYLLYIDCLVDGGASGNYAFDLSTGAGIALEYGVAGDDPEGTLADALDRRCQQQLREIEMVYFDEHPEGEAEHFVMQERLVACLTAAFPDQAGGGGLPADADLQAVADFIAVIEGSANSDGADNVAIAQCNQFSQVGEWRPFG